ncbi:MAG: hypothetical protein ACLPKT_06010 [Methylocella sp.]
MSNKIAVHDPEKRDSIKYVDGPAQGEIGALPDHQVAVVRRDGTRIGRVSRGASASVAERLLGAGSHGVVLGTHEGKKAWLERKGEKRVRVAPVNSLDKALHEASLRAAKGSVGKAHKPETHARPRRGG